MLLEQQLNVIRTINQWINSLSQDKKDKSSELQNIKISTKLLKIELKIISLILNFYEAFQHKEGENIQILIQQLIDATDQINSPIIESLNTEQELLSQITSLMDDFKNKDTEDVLIPMFNYGNDHNSNIG